MEIPQGDKLSALVAIFLFEMFIYLSILEHHKIVALDVGKMLGITITSILVLLCSAALAKGPSSPGSPPMATATLSTVTCRRVVVVTRLCVTRALGRSNILGEEGRVEEQMLWHEGRVPVGIFTYVGLHT
ncbi:hypothetical protein L208DRAFT_1375169 [Tricholoma matsutake]|nr:hypothetical protein L208DRAFT_1375169 [Tricholoma matsutake 945]